MHAKRSKTHLRSRPAGLRESREQFRLAQEALGIVTWIWDIAADRVQWHGNAAALLGLPAERFSGRFAEYLACLHPDDLATARQIYVDCLQGRRPEYRAVERVVWPDGSVHWLETYGRAEYGQGGRARRMMGVVKDVTEHRGLQEKAREAEQKNAALFTASPVGLVVTRPRDRRVLEINDVGLQILGLGRGEAVGSLTTELATIVDRDAFERLRSQALGGERVQGSLAIVRRDGREIELLLATALVKLGGEAHFVVSFADVTEQRRAERSREALLMNVARGVSAEVGDAFFRSLVEHLARELGADFCFIGELTPPGHERVRTLAFLADGKIAENGEYALEGSPCAHALTQRATVIHPERAAELFPQDVGLVRRGIQAYVGTPLTGAGGVPLGVLVVMHRTPVQRGAYWASMMEIFAARAAAEIERARAEALVFRTNTRLEQIVQERTAELEEANRELESYNFSISHDLRQPLSAIAGFAELLRESAAAGHGAPPQYVEEIERNAARMEQMIEALLQLSRAGRGALRPERIDMGVLVEDVVRDLRPGAPAPARVEVGDLPDAQADPVLLRQVWANLISNALKYSRTHPSPHIRIEGAARESGVHYEIRDNGVGFDMRHARRLFGAFHRLPSAAQFEGTGVGLAIVDRIVRRHGGMVEAHSVPGQGAQFRFTLPYASL